jgi:hypothetical protein
MLWVTHAVLTELMPTIIRKFKKRCVEGVTILDRGLITIQYMFKYNELNINVLAGKTRFNIFIIDPDYEKLAKDISTFKKMEEFEKVFPELDHKMIVRQIEDGVVKEELHTKVYSIRRKSVNDFPVMAIDLHEN